MQSFTIFAKRSISDVQKGSEYASKNNANDLQQALNERRPPGLITNDFQMS